MAANGRRLEEARNNLPPDAPISRDWSIDKTVIACAHLMETDLELLRRIQWAFSFREPRDPENLFGSVRKQVQTDIERQRATKFEQDVACHLDSKDDVLRLAHDYVVAFSPRREAEQALERGLFPTEELGTGSRDGSQRRMPMLPRQLGDLVAVRALGELQARDARSALKSILHAYAFAQNATEQNACLGQMSVSDGQRYIRTSQLYWLFDCVLERVIDDVWRDTPLSDDERRHVIAVVGWRPTRDELLQGLYVLAARRPRSVRPQAADVTAFGIPLPRFIANPVRTRGVSELLRELEPLMARYSYEVHDQHLALAQKLAPKADFTQAVLEWAVAVNELWSDRAAREKLLELVLALKDYARTHGEYPQRLDDVKDASFCPVPISPWTGIPYLYTSDGKTFTLISEYKAHSGKGTTVWQSKL